MSKESKNRKIAEKGSMSFVLFTAWVGALVFFVQHAEGFGGFFAGYLKIFRLASVFGLQSPGTPWTAIAITKHKVTRQAMNNVH